MKAKAGMYLFAGLHLLIPAWASAITIEVPAGETAVGGSVNSVVTQLVYGKTENFSILGTQKVMSGGIADGSNIYSYGQQDVLSGGISHNSLVQQYAVQNIDGVSYASSVNARGTIDVNSGGYAGATVVNGGNLYVNAGASASETVLNSGRVYLSGTAENTEVRGGTYMVQNGGVSVQDKITGGTMQVDVGGTSRDAVVSGRGTAQISGTAENITIENGGDVTIRDGATSESAILKGGDMTVDEEAAANNTEITAGTQYVYGTDTNAVISGGSQIVEGGGTVSDTVIKDAGTQQIGFNGSSINVRIEEGGTQTVSWEGKAENTTISGGVQQIDSGGRVENTTINSGTQQIASGGEAAQTAILGGTQEVSGTASASKIASGGKMSVLSGGSATQTEVAGGNMVVSSGGTSLKTEITGGTQYVYGTDSESIINGGSQVIESGGIAGNAQVNRGGTQTVSGIAQNTILNGGNQNITAGGRVENTTINSGTQQIASGGEAHNTTATGGIILLDGGVLSGRTSLSQALMLVSSDNNIPDLYLDDTLVTLIKKDDFTTLAIDRLNGNGTFLISSNLAQNRSDKIVVQDGSGDFGLIVHDYSGSGNLPSEYALIDKTSGVANNFYLVGGAVDIGAFQYDLQQNGNDWYLHRTQNHTDSAVIAKNTYSSLAALFYTHISPLYGRLHKMRGKAAPDDGLWLKTFGREIKFDYKDKSNSTTEAYGAELGYDRIIADSGNGTLRLGIFGALSDSRQKYDRRGRGDGKAENIGLYSSYQTVGGWFADIVGSYFWYNQKIKSYTPAGYEVAGKYHTNAWQASLHAGKRWNIGEDWFIEPYAGISYMRIDGISYRTNFNTLVEASAADYLGGTVGISGGRSFDLPSGKTLDIYGRAAVLHDWDGKSPVTVADEIFAEDTSSVRYELGGGLSASWDNGGSAYLEAATQLGSRVRFPWEISIGLQYSF